jgi:hypothetical protein
MSKITPKHSKIKQSKQLRHQYEFADFVQWIAMPKALRSPKTQRELAVHFGVGEDTLSEWKQRADFWNLVDEQQKAWGRERTPNVLLALHNRAVKTGDPRAVRLWYEIVEGKRFNDKAPEIICTSCEKYRELEALSDEELQAKIDAAEKFFKKK